jgi:hypothetical protein
MEAEPIPFPQVRLKKPVVFFYLSLSFHVKRKNEKRKKENQKG